MSVHALKNEFISVSKEGIISYGGNQTWSENAVIRKCGCGVIGSLDLLLYLDRYHNGNQTPETRPIPLKDYDRMCMALSRRYLPLLPPFGTNGAALALGVNRVFARYNMPFRASWQLSGSKMMGKVENMLDEDIPVILSIGGNFPFFWQENRVTLYSKDRQGMLHRASSAKAHYVTVTGSELNDLRISSWGREYYINKGEYFSYIHQHSNSIISNILMIERR